MFDQQRAQNQKPLTEEGVVELSDEQLEAVSGGQGSSQAAQYRYNQGFLKVMEEAYQKEGAQRSQVTVVNQTATYNNISAQAGNQTGVDARTYPRK